HGNGQPGGNLRGDRAVRNHKGRIARGHAGARRAFGRANGIPGGAGGRSGAVAFCKIWGSRASSAGRPTHGLTRNIRQLEVSATTTSQSGPLRLRPPDSRVPPPEPWSGRANPRRFRRRLAPRG